MRAKRVQICFNILRTFTSANSSILAARMVVIRFDITNLREARLSDPLVTRDALRVVHY